MRYGPDDLFWVVTDPTPISGETDICFQTSLVGLERQFRGGLTAADNPTLFTDEAEARVEAFGRLVAMRAAQAIRRRVEEGHAVEQADRIEVLDGEGNVLFSADLGSAGRRPAESGRTRCDRDDVARPPGA